MKIKNIIESTGGTTAGAVASVAMPMSGVQKRQGSLFKGKKTKKQFYEGKMKDLSYDIQYLDAGNFKKKYGMTKEEMVKSLKDRKSYADDQKHKVSEAELSEQDLIVVPGMRKSKDKSFISHKEDRRDHEVEMARSDLYAAAKDAMRIFKLLKDRSEDEGIMGWQQSYITLASDYLNSVADSLEYQMNMYEMTGGVIAGGMSNFEESLENEPPPKPGSLEHRALKRMKGPTQEDAIEALVIELGLAKFKSENKLYREYIPALMYHYKKQGMKEGRYYNPLDYERREQDAMDADRRRFKWDELSQELKGEEERARRYEQGPWYIRINGKLLRDKNKNPYTFNTLEAARKAANTMMKKDWNIGKNFSYSQTPTDQKIDEAKQHKCPECGGELVSEEMINEKKDACYYKVKSRYKVWPSAYASGALVKCRKKGASNWGTGGKSNESVAEEPLDEKWSKKYKDSINCKNPKGFSQKAHCAGRKK